MKKKISSFNHYHDHHLFKIKLDFTKRPVEATRNFELRLMVVIVVFLSSIKFIFVASAICNYIYTNYMRTILIQLNSSYIFQTYNIF